MRPGTAAIAAVCFTLAVQLCIAPASQAQPACAVDAVTADEALVVRPGQTFDIVLNTQPGTGYSWTVANEPDPNVVTLQDSQVLPPQMGLPGANERACFEFTAVAVGTTQVELVYARPFEPDTPAQAVTVTVSVRQPQPPVQLPNFQAGGANE